MTSRRGSTVVAGTAPRRQYAVAVLLLALTLLTVLGAHLHQVTTEATSRGIVCRDARDCAVPTQPEQDRRHHTPTLAARRTDQQPRRLDAAVPAALAAGVDVAVSPWTQGFHPETAVLPPAPPDRSTDLRAPPVAA